MMENKFDNALDELNKIKYAVDLIDFVENNIDVIREALSHTACDHEQSEYDKAEKEWKNEK